MQEPVVRAMQLCNSISQKLQNAILKMDEHFQRKHGSVPPRVAMIPFASISQNVSTRRTNILQDVAAADDEEMSMSAVQGKRPAKVGVPPWGRPPISLDDTSISTESEEKKTATAEAEKKRNEKFLIHQVGFNGVDRDLVRIAEEAIEVKQNFHYSANDIQHSLDSIVATGRFDQVNADVEDSRDGTILTFNLAPFPPFKGFSIKGANMLPPDVIADVFQGQEGKTSNLNLYHKGYLRINEWYADHGVLADVKLNDSSIHSGELTYSVTEAKINDIALKFVDKDGEPVKKHRTRDEVVMRNINTKPGSVWVQSNLDDDLHRCYATGLFENVVIVPNMVSKDDIVMNLTFMLQEKEKVAYTTGGIGFSSESQLPAPIGSLTFQHSNLFGKAQNLSAGLSINPTERAFNMKLTDPWIDSGPRKVSQVLSLTNDRKHAEGTFGRIAGEEVAENEVNANASSIAIQRLQAAIERSMPLSDSLAGTAGISMTQFQCVGADGNILLRDPYQWPMTRSTTGKDLLAKVTTSLSYSDRQSFQGVISLEKSIVPPKRRPDSGWLDFTRVTGSGCKEVPIGSAVLRLTGSAATHLGECLPYEARPLGGVNCVRGWAEGGLGTGRNWASGSIETQWPMINNVHGVIFVDGGTDFNSGQTVMGDPAGARGKPGHGLGYGTGVRVASPLGPIRLEYAWTDKSSWLSDSGPLVPRGRFHLGIGARF